MLQGVGFLGLGFRVVPAYLLLLCVNIHVSFDLGLSEMLLGDPGDLVSRLDVGLQLG